MPPCIVILIAICIAMIMITMGMVRALVARRG